MKPLTNEERLALSTLSRMRRKYDKKCALCGKKFEGILKAIYCSNGCKQKAWRIRKGYVNPSTKRQKRLMESATERYLRNRKAAESALQSDRDLSRKLRRIK